MHNWGDRWKKGEFLKKEEFSQKILLDNGTQLSEIGAFQFQSPSPNRFILSYHEMH
jgi:hypothetical protein